VIAPDTQSTVAVQARSDASPAPALLSVILPLKQPDAAVLRRCLASFAALPGAGRLELVVVHTGPLAAGLLDDHPPRLGSLRVVECATPGIYAAFNTGIEHAGGRFLLFFGHDDIALPDMQHALEALERECDERTLLACAMQVQGIGTRRPSRLRQGIVFRNWGHQALFYSAALLRTRRYDPRYPLRADHRLNIALLADPAVRCLRRREVVSYFSRGGYSSTTIADRHFDAEQAGIAATEFGTFWGLAVAVLVPTLRCARAVVRALFRAPGPDASRP